MIRKKEKGFSMLLFILSLIFLVPVALLPGLVDEFFSQEELYAMGIRLENSHG